MGIRTESKTVKSARKRHECTWCAEMIEVGESYVWWSYFDDNGASRVKLHPECDEALNESQVNEWDEGEQPRGCYCGFDADCERCKQLKEDGCA